MSGPLLMALCLLIALAPGAAHATDRFVDPVLGSDKTPAGPPNNCSSLAQGPCKTIQHALSRAGDFDRIELSGGTFPENLVCSVATDCPLDVTISGGWNTSFTSQGADPSLTVIDGQELGPTVDLDAEGGRVLLTFENLTIRGGNAVQGGGIRGVARNDTMSATNLEQGRLVLELRDCRIVDNVAQEGGGVWLLADIAAEGHQANYADLTVERCAFERNEAQIGFGGGIYALNKGAGLAVDVSYSEFHWNDASADGGAISLLVQQPAAITDFDVLATGFFFNDAVHGTSVQVRAEFSSNVEPNFTNNIHAANAEGLSAIRIESELGADILADMTNETVARNDSRGISVFEDTSSANATVRSFNMIVQDNLLEDIFVRSGASFTTRYSNIGTVLEEVPGDYVVGPGMINAPTTFVNPLNGDFHLGSAAAEIDKAECGRAVSVGNMMLYLRVAPLLDYDGDPRPPRFALIECDMGADEVVPEPGGTATRIAAIATLIGLRARRRRRRL